MGLFKVYHGPDAQISEDFSSISFHDGYAYFSEEGNLFYIDFFDSANQPTRRKIRVDQLINSDGDVIEVDDLFTTSDIIPVDNGGTGANNVADARTNLGVYSTTEVDTKAVTKVFGGGNTAATKITLAKLGWNQEGAFYKQTWSESALRCGATGNVPPLVAPLTNKNEWAKMDHADATAGSGIVFYATGIPSDDIEIVVVDIA